MRICKTLVTSSLCSVLALLLVLPITASFADYLEVRRSATIKDRPDRNALVVDQPPIGAHLPLLDNGTQVHGYYRVITASNDSGGWIYRTLVRRHPGNPPGFQQPAGSTTDGPGLTSSDIVRAHYIDVGQGDATLVEFPCGAIMIDVGGQSSATTENLIDYLDQFFARRSDLDRTIDTVFITHTHIDHNRALRRLVESSSIVVHNYVHNGVPNGSGRSGARWILEHANDDGRAVKS